MIYDPSFAKATEGHTSELRRGERALKIVTIEFKVVDFSLKSEVL